MKSFMQGDDDVAPAIDLLTGEWEARHEPDPDLDLLPHRQRLAYYAGPFGALDVAPGVDSPPPVSGVTSSVRQTLGTVLNPRPLGSPAAAPPIHGARGVTHGAPRAQSEES